MVITDKATQLPLMHRNIALQSDSPFAMCPVEATPLCWSPTPVPEPWVPSPRIGRFF